MLKLIESTQERDVLVINDYNILYLLDASSSDKKRRFWRC